MCGGIRSGEGRGGEASRRQTEAEEEVEEASDVEGDVGDELPAPRSWTWSAMLSAYVGAGRFAEVIGVFEDILRPGVRPNRAAVVGVRGAGAGEVGQWVHAFFVAGRGGAGENEMDGVVATAPVDMYAKCGSLDAARQIFRSMAAVYGMEPGLEHHGSLVDVLGLGRLLAEALDVVGAIPMRPDSYVLGALLNACRVHGDIELGRRAVECLAELGIQVRRTMEEKNVTTVPGCSMVEVDGVACEFVAGDRSHPWTREIMAAVRLEDFARRFELESSGQ